MATKKSKHIFIWKIVNLNLCTQKKDEVLRSPIFKTKNLRKSSWCIDLYPGGYTGSIEGWMTCFLRLCEISGPSEIICYYKIEILDSKRNIMFSNMTESKFIKGSEWGWPNVFEKSMPTNKDRYYDDIIFVRCEIKVIGEKYDSCSETLCVTKIHFNEYSFQSSVKNLNSECSEETQISHNKESQIEVLLKVPEDDIIIIIRRTRDLTELQSMSCQITLDVTGIKQDSKHALHLFEVEEDTWEFPSFLKRSKLMKQKEKYLKNDSLTLKFEIKLSSGSKSESYEYKQCTTFTSTLCPGTDNKGTFTTSTLCPGTDNTGTFTTLRDDMKKLFTDKMHADIKLIVDDQTILAHKSILSLRSPVFSEMFDSEMKGENDSGSVDIPDLEAETANSLLEFMYTDTLENLDHEIALKLLASANRYKVLALKEKCANFLKSTISDANVCDILLVADLVQHEVLEGACMNHIKENSECIFFSDKWKLVIEKNLQLAMKTVTKVSKLMVTQKKNDG